MQGQVLLEPTQTAQERRHVLGLLVLDPWRGAPVLLHVLVPQPQLLLVPAQMVKGRRNVPVLLVLVRRRGARVLLPVLVTWAPQTSRPAARRRLTPRTSSTTSPPRPWPVVLGSASAERCGRNGHSPRNVACLLGIQIEVYMMSVAVDVLGRNETIDGPAFLW